jgi:hypothetical protein
VSSPPYAYGGGGGERVPFRHQPGSVQAPSLCLAQCVPASAHCGHVHPPLPSGHTTHPTHPCRVQNPIVRMRIGQNGIQPLQRAEGSGGYPCLDHGVIVACRCHLMRGIGIGSCRIPVHLHDGLAHHCARGCDALGCEQRCDQFLGLAHLFDCHTVVDQLFDFLVVHNCI